MTTATIEYKDETFDMDLIDKAMEMPRLLSPTEQLTAIATLRRQLYGIELRQVTAKEALENTREWDEWQALKEERKELQKKLDSVLDRTMSLWSQPELGL